MSKKVYDNVTITDARIIFRNFAGAATKYNPPGKRNFCVILEPGLAEKMAEDGWNVKFPEPREDGAERDPYIQVAVQYGNIPPKIVQVTSRGQTPISEDLVHVIDWAEIKKIDLTIRPYNWEIESKDGVRTGVKAYLKTMYYTIEEDELELMYADIPGIPDNSINAMIETTFEEITERPMIEMKEE